MNNEWIDDKELKKVLIDFINECRYLEPVIKRQIIEVELDDYIKSIKD